MAGALSRMPQYKSHQDEIINSIIPLPQSISQVITRDQTQGQSTETDSRVTQKLREELKTDT